MNAFTHPTGLRQLRRRPARFRIRLDDQPPITRAGQSLLIANLGRLQGGITVVPDAQPDDGVLDVAVLGTRTPVDWLRLATQVLLRRQRQPEQQHQAGPPLELFRARRVEVDCDRVGCGNWIIVVELRVRGWAGPVL